MQYNFTVEFQVRKGLGPEWVTKNVDVGFDDVEPDVPLYIIEQWAIADAKRYLESRDCPVYVFVEIYQT